MNDPAAIRFLNERLRPICERARAFKIELESLRTEWDNGISDHFGKADSVDDGREAEGVSRLSTGDVSDAMAQLLKIALGGAAQWDDAIIAKPCVRALEVR